MLKSLETARSELKKRAMEKLREREMREVQRRRDEMPVQIQMEMEMK